MKPVHLILAAAGVLAFAAWSTSQATATRRKTAVPTKPNELGAWLSPTAGADFGAWYM